MKFSCALKLNHIFRRLYATAGYANSYLVLYAKPNRSTQNRVGVTVGKKLGHAVVRNRVRRRFREIYRLHEAEFGIGWDLVIVARTRAVGAPYAKLDRSFLSLCQKLNLLSEKGDHPEDAAH